MTSRNIRGRGRPPVDSERVDTRLPRETLDGLDSWREDQDPVPTRPEAIRYALRDWLIGMGILPLDSKQKKGS